MERISESCRDQLVRFVSNAPAAMALVDARLDYLAMSARYRKEFCDDRDGVGRSAVVASPDLPPEWRHDLSEALRGESRARSELGFTDRAGARRWATWSIGPWRDELGAIGGALIIGEDLTEAKRCEAARVASMDAARSAVETSRAKTAFFASLSHELRTPLGAVLGISEALVGGTYGPLTEAQTAQLDTLQHSARHLLELVNEVLDLARVEGGKVTLQPTDVSLDSVVTECLAMMTPAAEARSVRLEARRESNDVALRADRLRVKQMVLNLLQNAINVSAPQTTVTLSTALTCTSVEIAIEDEGPGVPRSERARIFEPFERLDGIAGPSRHGAGLGLAVVASLAKLHDGTVRVEDRHPAGSRFVLSFPSSRAMASGDEKRAIAAPTSILLVEDNPLDVATIEPYLMDRGFVVDVVNDGLSAVRVAASKDFALILMDLRLPGIDGLEAIRRIRQATRGGAVPILALSCVQASDVEAQCFEAGATAFFEKPLSLAALARAIDTVVTRGGATTYGDERGRTPALPR